MIPTSPPPDLAGAKVLLADSDRTDLAILATLLREHGCGVTEVTTGALALAAYAERKPDLVLLALTPPGLDGYATGHQLRQAHGEECAPLIFLTDPTEPGRRDHPAPLDGELLRKPFHPAEVLTRLRTQLQIRQLVQHQQVLCAQLADAHNASRRFLGNAAHDLRNPLGAIGSLANFLKDGTVGDLSPEQLELVNTIQESSRETLALVNDLLEAVTIEAGGLTIVRELHSLDELVGQSVYLARISAAGKKISLTLDPAPGLAALIDAAKIKQVIDNLLTNAVKFSPPGSTVTVALLAGHNQVGFSVKDQGPGIPPGERGKLFQDFGRLSVRPTGGENSTGLGLAICRKIVEAHGGTITAENLPGGGCEFRVTLPPVP